MTQEHCFCCFLVKKCCLEALFFLFSVPKVCGFDLVARPESLSTGAGFGLTSMGNALYIYFGHRLFAL